MCKSKMTRQLLASIAVLFLLTACSTRETADKYRGSTSQRLVTYSINDLMQQIPEDNFQDYGDKSVYVRTHFLQNNQVLRYADQRLNLELQSRFNLNLTDELEQADYELDFFFTSLGTDSDAFGLTVPIFWVSTDGGELPTLDILAVRMYHGVSEMYYYSTDRNTGTVKAFDSLVARAKTDKFSTPFFSFPLDDLND